MTVENIDLIQEMYEIMVQYIPTKDKQEMADHLISSLVDLLTDDELQDFCSYDSYLKKAIKEYIIQDNDTDADDEC